MTHYPEANRLANALSPYLRQHAGNPVFWREWGDAALDEARQTDRPILLSVGYAACHWCHVMAHESFEDVETAALMNRHFVNVKVDREERPDVDQLYMNALHAMGEQGGWPLTMFLTPDGTPFWGGTYFPPESRYGRPGFRDVLRAIHDLHVRDPAKIASNAGAISAHLQRSLEAAGTASRPELQDLSRVATRLLSATDAENAGLAGAPKFPSASMWEALWRGWVRDRDPAMREAAIAWIRALCRGGIYDHLGGGLHRYAVDGRWLVPHFEKMLYDNAQFVRALTVCLAATSDPLFRLRLEETADFMLTGMRAPEGGFHSSIDADSEGEEGRYYVWSRSEIDAVLGHRAPVFRKAYDVSPEGNWEGKTILNLLSADPALLDEQSDLLAGCRRDLLSVRRTRPAPATDDKVLADWNGLAIRALAEAGTALGRRDWVEGAVRAYDFVTESIVEDGALAHAWRDGRVAGPALATDYASMIAAAVALHLATGDTRYLDDGKAWADRLEARHADGNGSYFLASAERSDLIVRARNEQDDATPSATAMVIEAQARLAGVAQDPGLAGRADRALAAAWGRIRDNPFGSVAIVNAADTVLRAPKLVMTGPGRQALGEVASRHPDPARLDLRLTEEDALMRHVGPAAGDPSGAAAYLCRGPVCLPPVSNADDLDRLLSEPVAAP